MGSGRVQENEKSDYTASCNTPCYFPYFKIIQFSSLLVWSPLYLTIINPKANIVKSRKLGRNIPEASPHAASEAVSPRSVSLTLSDRCCFLRGCLCLSTLGSLPEVPGDGAASPFLGVEPGGRSVAMVSDWGNKKNHNQMVEGDVRGLENAEKYQLLTWTFVPELIFLSVMVYLFSVY